jgi:hypothetical protein
MNFMDDIVQLVTHLGRINNFQLHLQDQVGNERSGQYLTARATHASE